MFLHPGRSDLTVDASGGITPEPLPTDRAHNRISLKWRDPWPLTGNSRSVYPRTLAFPVSDEQEYVVLRPMIGDNFRLTSLCTKRRWA